MLLETQQNSDITYRVYDYDRLSDGCLRQLHVEQSKAVTTVPAVPAYECISHPEILTDNEISVIASKAYYEVSHIKVNGHASFMQTETFRNVSVLEGTGLIDGTQIRKGDHLIIPAGYGLVKLEGEMTLFMSTPGMHQD